MVVQLCKSVRIKVSPKMGLVCVLSRMSGDIIKSKAFPRCTVQPFIFYFL